MPVAPVAKGLIIVASVVVAAGVAIYENPQVRQWVDTSRRKIAVALHSLGDEINPSASRSRRNSAPSAFGNRSNNQAEDARKHREDVLRKNRADMIRKAKEEGVAVDLNELAVIGRELEELRNGAGDGNSNADEPHTLPKRRGRSFDELVDNEGKLVGHGSAEASTTAVDNAGENLRQRGAAIRGVEEETLLENPFADENTTEDAPEQTTDSQSLLTTSRLSQLDMSFAHTSAEKTLGDRQDASTTGAVAATSSSDDGFDDNYHSVSEHQPNAAEVMSGFGDDTSEGFSEVDGAPTPSSWTEVGSVDGESDLAADEQ
jgi:hypothetical protein